MEAGFSCCLGTFFLGIGRGRVIFIDRYTISVIEKRDGQELQVGLGPTSNIH
jgi:hypothetical protein